MNMGVTACVASGLIILVGISTLSFADEITTLSGETYTDVKVKRKTPLEITVSHSSGVATIPFNDLPGELKRKYGYNVNAAINMRNRQTTRRQLERISKRLDQNSIYVNAELNQVTEEGALAYVTVIEKHERTYDAVIKSKGKPQKLSHGPAQETHHEWRTKRWTSRKKLEEPIFIVGDWSGYYDGETWSGRVYPAGTLSYTTTMGAAKRVAKYATTKRLALHHLSIE